MKLKNIACSVVIAGIATSAMASGNKKPVSQWTCADFLAVEAQFRPKVIYAATAYSKAGKPEAEFIDIDGTERVTPMVVAECTKSPQASFMEKLKAEWQKVESALKVK